MASHPNTLRNLQQKMSITFDKQVLKWKDDLERDKKLEKFINEVVAIQTKEPKENGMDICTVDMNKEAVIHCKNYTEEVYNVCQKRLPAVSSNIYTEEDILAVMKSDSGKPNKYR